ncbi:hypothetical protein LCGC14_2570770, partial [marine sediment metagenome]
TDTLADLEAENARLQERVKEAEAFRKDVQEYRDFWLAKYDEVTMKRADGEGRLKRDMDEARSNSVPGLSHSVLTTYGAPNGLGMTLLGRIEALGDKCDRSTERWTKAEAVLDRLRGEVAAMRDQLKVTQGLLMARVGRLSVSQSGEVIGDIRALLESDAGAPEAAVIKAAVEYVAADRARDTSGTSFRSEEEARDRHARSIGAMFTTVDDMMEKR